MSKSATWLVLGASLAIFATGIYFNSKPALVIGFIYSMFAILDIEISGMD